ncbi:MAG: lipid-A-disaccharide synthase [Alphaproteobacteria bacterium]
MSGTLPTARAPLIYLVAGEPSGDQLGAGLMRGLRDLTGGNVRFAGIGGDQMTAEGLASRIDIRDLAVMGGIEVLSKVPAVFRHLRSTAADILATRPDIVVTIDSPGFAFRLAPRIAKRGIPLVHYVAPSVWAWKPGRAAKIAGFLDHLLAILPFEPPYFTKHGLPTDFVGHPVVEFARRPVDPAAFRQRHGIAADALVLTALPGSRMGEVTRLLPIFGRTFAMLQREFPNLHVVVPTVSTVADHVARAIAKWPVPTTLLRDAAEKHHAYAASRAALAASGTVAVELAVAGVPAVITYRGTALSAAIAKRVLTIKFASIVNLLHDRAVQPELLQYDGTPENLAATLRQLLTDEARRAAMLADYRVVVAQLTPPGGDPNRRAAEIVLAAMRNGPRPENAPSKGE